MDRTIQDLAWRCLPREFKEEVKIYYQYAYVQYGKSDLYRGSANAIESLFGHHNLTSDAEGEDEMLYVSRKKLQYFYESLRKVGKNHAAFVLRSLFGSKCLPDEEQSAKSAHCLEPKPTEPKFKKWDKVLVKADTTISKDMEIYKKLPSEIKRIDGETALIGMLPKVMICDMQVRLSNLEPYIEPTDHIVQDHEMVDTIIKDGFLGERRLNIAAQMMQGLICAPLIPGCNPNPPAEQLAQTAFRLADAFIAEAEKGGKA